MTTAAVGGNEHTMNQYSHHSKECRMKLLDFTAIVIVLAAQSGVLAEQTRPTWEYATYVSTHSSYEIRGKKGTEYDYSIRMGDTLVKANVNGDDLKKARSQEEEFRKDVKAKIGWDLPPFLTESTMLNRFGIDGWEMVTAHDIDFSHSSQFASRKTSGMKYYFKRMIAE